jgi:hypothetical protein
MTLFIADSAKGAGSGDINQPFGEREEIIGQGAVNVHSALGVITNIVPPFSRGAQARP